MDLIDYIPSVLRPVRDFEALTEAEQPEYDAANDALDDAFEQFVLSAMGEETTGDWERALGIVPPEDSELARRRDAIRVAMRSRLPYTYRVLDAYLSQAADSHRVMLDHNAYAINIAVEVDSNARFWAIVAELKRMLPANLLRTFGRLVFKELGLYLAAAHITRTHHTHALPRRGIPGAAPLRMGVAHFVRTVREHTTTSSIIHVSRAAAIPWHSGAAGAVYVSASAAEDE